MGKHLAIRDAAAEWSWAVLALACAIFVLGIAVAVARGPWTVGAISAVGLVLFGGAAWRKYAASGEHQQQPVASAEGEQAYSLTPGLLLMVCGGGLLFPLYVAFRTGKFSSEAFMQLWPIFGVLWLLGVLAAGVFAYAVRYMFARRADGEKQ